MPGLYVRDAGGVSRKCRELHEAQGGVDRKLREMYARDTQGVSRRVFSGYDCKGFLADEYTSTLNGNRLTAEGDIYIELTAEGGEDRGSRYCIFQFEFAEAISWSGMSSIAASIISPASSQRLNNGDEWVQLFAFLDGVWREVGRDTKNWSEFEILSSHTVSGTANKFRLKWSSYLSPSTNVPAYLQAHWGAGSLALFGQPITSIELI